MIFLGVNSDFAIEIKNLIKRARQCGRKSAVLRAFERAAFGAMAFNARRFLARRVENRMNRAQIVHGFSRSHFS